MYKIIPLDYGLDERGRLLYYDLRQKKFFKKQLVEPNEIIEIKNKIILSNILNFKFKFQKRVGDDWVDVSNFFFLEKGRNIATFFVDQSTLSAIEIDRMIKVFNDDIKNHNYSLALTSFKKAINYIAVTSSEKIVNIRNYLKIAHENYQDMTQLWKNITVYLTFSLKRKEYFEYHNLTRISYENLHKIFVDSPEHQNFIKNEIDNLNNYEIETAHILKGLYYSFMKDRKEAAREFKSAINGDIKLIKDMGIGEGIFSYEDEVAIKSEYENEVIDLTTNENTSEFTILMSLDPNFLRKYGPQLFYSIISLKKYHFHFHLVGNKSDILKVFSESVNLFDTMKEYIKPSKNVIHPSFSYEECPVYVKDPVTLYACARFLNAPRIMEKFNSKILVIDADYYINNDFEKYFNSLSDFDISMAVSWGIKSMRPWGRYMAGSVYINNNEIGKAFLKELNSYINDKLRSEHTWTLDQNALTFAMERIRQTFPRMRFENGYKLPRPLVQPSIRRYIEK